MILSDTGKDVILIRPLVMAVGTKIVIIVQQNNAAMEMLNISILILYLRIF